MATIDDLMKRIDELEQRLAPPPKPSLNELLRELAKDEWRKTGFTVELDTMKRKDTTNG